MKLKDVAAGFVNGALVAGMIAVGMVQSQEAHAQERLQAISAVCCLRMLIFDAFNSKILARIATSAISPVNFVARKEVVPLTSRQASSSHLRGLYGWVPVRSMFWERRA